LAPHKIRRVVFQELNSCLFCFYAVSKRFVYRRRKIKLISKAIKYAIAAHSKTEENPKLNAIITLKMELRTDKQPLTPHTQGIKRGAIWLTKRRAKGNGIPIKKPSGDNRNIVTAILNGNFKPIIVDNSLGKTML
jgi:hypothetical protein